MSRFADLKVKLIKWSKNHKKLLIALAILFVVIVYIINSILKRNLNKINPPSTTYNPHQSVYDSEKTVPENYKKPIEDLVSKYFNYCNNGEYENAYNLITEDCKNKLYPTLESFKNYVDYVFQGKKKIYNIQNYSIVDNKYIYNIRILDDILATGTNDGYYYYEEKIVLIEENGQFKLSIGEYIEDKKMNIIAEDDNMVIEIQNVSVDYETETYTVRIRNKTDKYLVIADNTQKNEIVLDIGEQTRRPTDMEYYSIYAKPNQTIVETLKFNKFYDNGLTAQKLIFGSIRVLNEYDFKQGTTQENLDNAVKLYAYEINLNK